MSYESRMLDQLGMPSREDVMRVLLLTLLKHGGVIKEFGSGEQEIVDELATEFKLNAHQRTAVLQTVYRKENRVKNAFLWHRLLFRAADLLAKAELVSRPTETIQLTNKREWMLTEKGLDRALRMSNISPARKDDMAIRSVEVQRVVKQLKQSPWPAVYNPIDKGKTVSRTTRAAAVRARGFRQAITEAYGYHCSVCGLKIPSPDGLYWEVEAAHIVPNRSLGRDDVWNGLALCHIHHWAFDVGWFTLRQDYTIEVSNKIVSLPSGEGRMVEYEIIRDLAGKPSRIRLPDTKAVYPHPSAIVWHRENVFNQLQLNRRG
jgi:hypothetical protein